MQPKRGWHPPDQLSPYGWHKLTVGEWHRVRFVEEAEPTAQIINQRMRTAAAAWAKRRGMRVESRSAREGAEFFIRFREVS